MRARTSVVAVVLAALFVGLPAVAYAATAEYRFDATKLGNQRLQDFNSPTVSSGRVTSDMDGTACDSTYDYQLVRHRSYLPDEVVHRNAGARACDGEIVRSGLSWSAGLYHFDVRVMKRQESNLGGGFARATW